VLREIAPAARVETPPAGRDAAAKVARTAAFCASTDSAHPAELYARGILESVTRIRMSSAP